MLCHPGLIETGMNLIQWLEIVFAEPTSASGVCSRLISVNPAKEVDLPQLTKDRARVLALAEGRGLLKAADGKLDRRKTYTTKDGRSKTMPNLSTRYALVYHLLLALGLRRGEGLGFSWDDLGWEVGTVQIRRQVQAINTRVVISDYTKTDSGRRTLPISPTLLARLRAHSSTSRRSAH